MSLAPAGRQARRSARGQGQSFNTPSSSAVTPAPLLSQASGHVISVPNTLMPPGVAVFPRAARAATAGLITR